MSNWSYNSPVGQQGSTTVGGGGALAGFRSILDARLSMATGRTPEAQYPDGYLGSVIDRREDKLLQTVRNNARSYTRGVHKGSSVPQTDYFWTDDFNPMTGLEFQRRGKKWTASGSPVERLAHGGKFVSSEEARTLAKELNIPYDANTPEASPAQSQFHLRTNAPSWR